ncbi:DMT family transporter [Massilia sp. R2A-15]|uniref:DMT family transporter n=1 Tax=Massilia sp. R2A-15 TaxID=3064278 RepID=UPI002737144C|nr:DMT family transporter [Massilia sp. R2A-15]WLI89775.1 DMT family transporter [Massilia sp. R2A-15]
MASMWMLAAAFLFSVMGACVKLASASFSISEIVMYRGLIGVVMLSLLVRHQGGSLRTVHIKDHLWRGFVGVLSLWLWFYGISKLPLATAVTLNYMSPIWMAAFLFCAGWWHSKDHVEWPLVGAILLSFIGVTLVLQPAFEARQWLGAITTLCSGMLSAAAYLQVRKLSQLGEPEYRVVFYFSVVNLMAGLAGSATTVVDPSVVTWHALDLRGAALMLTMGVSATLAQMAMTRAYGTGKTLVVANLQYTGIIFSSVWGMLLWGDRFDWHVWLGMAVILGSGLAVTYYNTRSTDRGTAVEKTDPIASET